MYAYLFGLRMLLNLRYIEFFVHVPSAIFSELVYIFMAVNGFIYLVWRTKISAIFLSSAINIGLVFTAIVLVTGALWGKPTWGTYCLGCANYLNICIVNSIHRILALKSSFNSKETADQIVSIVAIIGAINIPIIKFSVEWWNTLHQSASITFSGSSIDAEMLYVTAYDFIFCSFGFLYFQSKYTD